MYLYYFLIRYYVVSSIYLNVHFIMWSCYIIISNYLSSGQLRHISIAEQENNT